MTYDFVIVGAGLFGSVFAYLAKSVDKSCLILEKRNHIGGNCYTENIDGINVHKYGPHIFHTNNKEIWKFVNEFVEFNSFVNRPKVVYKNELYSFPINLFTLYQLYGVKNPQEALNELEKRKIKFDNPEQNLETWILSQVGEEIYKKFIYGYTKKQWNEYPKNLPSSIIKRLPIRTSFDDNYYVDKYQGIPIGGYTNLFKKLTENIPIEYNVDFLKNKDYWIKKCKKIIYTGSIDEYYEYTYGILDYRSLKFEEEKINIKDYQGSAVVNFTDEHIPFTRTIEHKHFEKIDCDTTIISKEYPLTWKVGLDRYYPINTEKNNNIYKKYREQSEKENNLILGGRLAEYMYYDMHQVIGSAFNKFKKIN